MTILSLAGALLVPLEATPVAAQPSRSQVGKAVQEAMAYARTLPDAFGGLWLTDEGAVFAFTHRATHEQIADVLSRIKRGIPVTTVRVDWSDAEIAATKDAIVDFVQTQGPPQVVMGVGTDLQGNAVLVGILPEYFEVCQAGLTARFAPVRLRFESSGPDRGLPEPTSTPDATASPTPSPDGSLPPACLPPSSPEPSGLGASPGPNASVGPSPTAPTAPTAPTVEYGPMAIVEARNDLADTGVEGGHLVIGERCVTIRASNGPSRARATLVFREGQVIWDAEHHRICFHSKVGGWLWLHDGDLVGTMGGWDPWTDTDLGLGVPAWVVQPNPACPADRVQIHEIGAAPHGRAVVGV
jgi:hypothetical protein